VKIRISRRARIRIRAIDAWWRAERRDAADLFKQELARTFTRILQAPKARKPYAEIEGEPVWRILMPRTEQHIYYSVDDTASEIVIETVWLARRGRGPKL
jgi:plasmid stabilization system protein ParE